jgi:Ni,Fe-hydrogenase III component G
MSKEMRKLIYDFNTFNSKKLNENKVEINLVNDFIDYLFNDNDLFYNIGDGEYKYNKDNGTITIDLSLYDNQKYRFVKQIQDFINSDIELNNGNMSGDISIISSEDDTLILSVR